MKSSYLNELKVGSKTKGEKRKILPIDGVNTGDP